MYIRIKFKHMLLILGISLLLVVSGFYFRGYPVYLLGRANEITGAPDKAGVYYDRASDMAAGSMASIQAAKRKIEMFSAKNNISFMMSIDMHGSSSMMNGPVMDYESITEINQRYAQISANAAKSNLLAEYAMEVAFMNYFAADANRTLDILDSLDYITDSDLLSIKRLYTSMINMRLGNMEKGFNAIKDDLDKKDHFEIIRQELKRYYLFYTGDYDGFSEIKIDNWYNKTHDLEDTLIKPLLSIQNDMSGYNDIVRKERTAAKTENSLTGRVLDEGKPMPYVLVYLKHADYMYTHFSSTGASPGVVRAVLTDKDGYFRIDNVPDGTYGIGFCVEWSRVSGKTVLMNKRFNLKFTGSTKLNENISFIDTEGMVKVQDMGDGKFKFDFNMPEGAAYYTISIGELYKNKGKHNLYNNSYPTERIRENSYVVDTARELRNGMMAGLSYGSSGVDPYEWIEPFYHTGDYAYCVNAYDSKGDIMADSRGIYPVKKKETIHIQGSEWSEADRLLLDGKYDEAIKEYEKQVETNSGDSLHATKVLAKLYNNGWIYNKKTYRLDGRDNTKAKKYMEMLDAKIDNDYVKSSLADIYIREKEYSGALEILSGLAEESGYDYHRMGRVYGYLSNYSEAEEAYKKYYEKIGNGADYILMLYVLEGKDDMLAEWAPKHDSNSYNADYVSIVSEYLKIDRSNYAGFFNLIKAGKTTEAEQLIKPDESELANFYKGVLELQKHFADYTTREKTYTSYYEKVKAPGIKKLMKYFGKAGLNSGFGDFQ